MKVPEGFEIVECGGHAPPVLANVVEPKLSREDAMAMVDAGYMPLSEYIERFGRER